MTSAPATTETRPTPSKTAQIGNLTRVPDLRFSAKGTAWATCGLAVSHRFRDEAGDWHEAEPTFYEIVAFGDLAEHFAESAVKGSRVVVCGRVEEDTWTAKDGTERTGLKLLADDIGLSLRWATAVVEKVTHKTPATVPSDGGDEWDDAPF